MRVRDHGFPWIATLLMVAVTLAGCAGDDSTPQATVGPGADGGVEDGAVLRGTVVDEELRPVANAELALLEADLTTTSDEQGQFSFEGVAPGSYTLLAQRLGFESFSKRVQLAAGDAVELRVDLVQIAISEPYSESFGPYQGYFQCRASTFYTTGACGFTCPIVASCINPLSDVWDDEAAFNFNMTSDDYRSVIGEMRWEQGSFATSQEMRMSFSYENRTSSHWFCSGEGPSPLQWRLERDEGAEADDEPDCMGASQQLPDDEPKNPTTDLNLRIYANVPFGRLSTDDPQPSFVAYEQRFEMMATIFHVDPAPDDFTGFPDA